MRSSYAAGRLGLAIFGHSNATMFVSENGERNRRRARRLLCMANVNSPERHVSKTIDSPVGALTLVATDAGLSAILWENDRPGRVRLDIRKQDENHPVLRETERQLREYFAGRRTRFTVKLDMKGTAFQLQVWNALLTIPFGETRSYRQIAEQIGSPDAVRAVGAANGRNPVSTIAPCHRVIGSNGALTGFAGGLETKAFLLAHEGASTEAARVPAARR